MLGDSVQVEKEIFSTKATVMYGYLFTIAGLICFFEGLPYLATPHHLKKWLQWVVSTPTRHLRLLGAVLMVAGLAMVYWGRNHGG